MSGSRMLIDGLESRVLFTGSGAVDTTKPFYFKTSDVPAMMDWIISNTHDTGNYDLTRMTANGGYMSNADAYINGNANGWSPLNDRGDLLLQTAAAYRFMLQHPEQQGTHPNNAAAYGNAVLSEIGDIDHAYVSGPSAATNRAAWNPLDAAKSIYQGVAVYYLMAGTSAWTSSAQSTFNNLLGTEGDLVYNANRTFQSVPNQRAEEYTALYVLGNTSNLTGYQVFSTEPRASNWDDWKVFATPALNNQVFTQGTGDQTIFRPDGGFYEMSSLYAGNTITAMSRVGYLDKAIGGTPSVFTSTNAANYDKDVDALYAQVDPNGNLTSSGDSDGSYGMSYFILPTALRQNASRWNNPYPDLDDLFIAWADHASTSYDYSKPRRPSPDTSSLASLRNDGLMPQTGLAPLHGTIGSTSDSVMAEFDISPYGSYSNPSGNGSSGYSGHGSMDLLNLDIDGNSDVGGQGQPLLLDAGKFDDSNASGTAYRKLPSSHNAIDVISEDPDASGKYYYMNEGAIGFQNVGFNDTSANKLFGATFSGPSATGSWGGGTQVAGAQREFYGVSGSNTGTTVYRTVYSDGAGLYIVGDWTHSDIKSATVTLGFNLPSAHVSAISNGYQTTYSAGDNMQLQRVPVTVSGMTTSAAYTRTFSGDSSILRTEQSAKGTDTAFVTILQTYHGTSAPVYTYQIDTAATTSTVLAVKKLNSSGTVIAEIKLQRFGGTLTATSAPLTSAIQYVPPGGFTPAVVRAVPAAQQAMSTKSLWSELQIDGQSGSVLN